VQAFALYGSAKRGAAMRAPETKYIITTNLDKEELIAGIPALQDKKDRVFTVDAIRISLDTIGRSMPNTPILGALMKVSNMLEIDFFLESMKRVLAKFPQKIIDANMEAITRAYNEVK